MKYIKLFATGGTFDKEFNEINGDLEFQKTNLYELLELGRCKLDIKIETLMMIDSLKMSDSERNYILSQFNLLKSVGLLNSEHLKIR